jgi:transglutaminase-like putative cysteine protease
VGDEIVLTTLLNQRKPWIPGQFASGIMFEPGVAQHDARFSVSVPADYPLHMDESGMQGGEPVTEGGKTRRSWTYRNDTATPPEPGAVMNVNGSPHVFVSSFSDYRGVALAARTWFEGKAQVTPEIQALADKLTAGITVRRKIAEKLYDWVSSHITYEQIVLGEG